MDYIVRAEKISKVFKWKKSEVVALKEVDFELESGESVGIWGPSGAGKTTLLHILGTLEKPTSGKLFFEEKDITLEEEKNLSKLRKYRIGFIFQFHHLLPELTAIENVMTPLQLQGLEKEEAFERSRKILEEVGLNKRLFHRPGELSGGERQRVAVARALVIEPSVVLADEPTGDLDTRSGDEVFLLLLELNRRKNSSLVVATHNSKLLENIDRVVEILDGKVAGNNYSR